MIGRLVRTVVGATAGAAIAGAALRARMESQRRGVPIGEVLPNMPDLLKADARTVVAAARGAIDDGVAAARRQQQELDAAFAGPRSTGVKP